MKQDYSFLEPIKIGNIQLKNRIIQAPMSRWLASDEGYVTDQFCANYERVAKGGAGLVLPGTGIVDSTWPFTSNNELFLDDDKFLPGMKRFTDTIHNAGAKVGFQLWCCGLAHTTRSINDFTLEDIRHMQAKYVDAARRCKAAGADVVEFHLAHTYLPCEFLSPAWNQRTDEYGADTVENAIRFSYECIKTIHDELCDGTFEIIVKVNGTDFTENGITPEWCAEACTYLEKAGVSLITVNAAGWLVSLTLMSDDGKRPEGWKTYLAESIRKRVNIPVAAMGSIRHPEYADWAIRSGKCDMIALARELLADPEWVKKTVEGREDEIRHCTSCMFCFNNYEPGHSACSVNPFAKRELEYSELPHDGLNRKVSVVGAGPAGLEAAVTLAQRGFAVTLFDQFPRIGGQVALTASLPGKSKRAWQIEYYNNQIRRLGIRVVLGQPVTIDMLRAMNPYAVVTALGDKEILPELKGAGADRVLLSRSILAGQCQIPIKKNVVIIGYTYAAFGVAQYLCSFGNHVTVLVESAANSAATLSESLAISDAVAAGAQVLFQQSITEITDDCVSANNADGKSINYPADVVIAAPVPLEVTDLKETLNNTFDKVVHIPASANLPSAEQAGCDAARALS